MIPSDWLTLIDKVGFSSCIAVILLYFIIKTNQQLMKIIENNTKALVELKDIVKDLKTHITYELNYIKSKINNK